MKKCMVEGSDYGYDRMDTLFDEGGAWDFVVMNDFTQAPARQETREATLDIFRTYYATKLSNSTVVLLETFGYVEERVNNSEDLGTFEEFQDALVEGYESYRGLLSELGVPCKIAKVGSVFRKVKEEDEELWRRLYFSDKYHPSPLGTFLSSCVIHKAIFSTDITMPETPADAFEGARHMSGRELPTLEEMKRVWEIAKRTVHSKL